MSAGEGALVLVATPIGNLGDLSPRAVSELAAADLVCCEDTRRTGRLLAHAGVDRPRLLRVDDHTEARAVREVLRRLGAGERVAVVSDAGTPGISDPGERLVRAAVHEGFAVEVVPGPSAAIAGLVVSGLPTGRFVFEGFLPRKGSHRRERLAALASEERTMVLFEAPHRAARTLADLAEVLGGDRAVAVARELSKLHEELFRGTLEQAAAWAEEARGELVVVVEGAAPRPPAGEDTVRRALEDALAEGLTRRDAVARVADELGVPRRTVYAIATGTDAGGAQDGG